MEQFIFIMKKPLNYSENSQPENSSKSISRAYREGLDYFRKAGFSQLSGLFLCKIINDYRIKKHYRNYPLQKIMHKTAKTLLMNEMEIAMWGLILEQLNWDLSGFSLKQFLLLSGFAAKKSLNKDLAVISSHLDYLNPSFSDNFYIWFSRTKPQLKLSVKKLNKKYLEFSSSLTSGDSEIMDYNFYVDKILESAPPSELAEAKSASPGSESPISEDFCPSTSDSYLKQSIKRLAFASQFKEVRSQPNKVVSDNLLKFFVS